MAKLFKLLSGKIGRKTVINEDGLVGNTTLKKGDIFVPSPSEYSTNKKRLVEAGEIADDSPENRDAYLNTNLMDNPGIRAPKLGKNTVAPVVTATADIRQVKNTEVAISTVNATTDLKLVEEFLTQEMTNPDRVRASVVKAIKERIKELGVETV